MTECKKDSDENRLIREGTTQEERFPVALDPAYAPVDDWKIEHGILFAKAYAKFLKYYDAGNREAGDWQPFFSKDVSALLAVMAMQDMEECRNNIKIYTDNWNEDKDKNKNELGKIINCIGAVAKQIDVLKEGLPDEYPLKATLSNLVKNRLSDNFEKLILFCKKHFFDNVFSLKECGPSFKVIRSESCTNLLTLLEEHTFSLDWIPKAKASEDKTWIEYLRELYAQQQESDVSDDKAGVEQLSNNFLLVYARTVTEARRVLEDSLKNWNRHEPHYALFLAFLRLMEHARNELNTLTGRHLDFYYREILQFKEKEVVPPKAHVLVELAKQVPSYLIKAGEEFKAGKDELGKDVFFASERDFVANRAKVAALKTVFCYEPDDKVNEKDAGRIYTSSVANSEDGQDGELISEDKSWHPFFNKKYENGKLSKIEMPKAEIGFAIASHYLWMAGGQRKITVYFSFTDKSISPEVLYKKNVLCLFTGKEGWIKQKATFLKIGKTSSCLILRITISVSYPAIVQYSEKIHGYNFATNLPVLLLKLQHQDDSQSNYAEFKNIVINSIKLVVSVDKLKNIAVSNDFGPIDISKPFQPFGASPVQNSALIIGSKEMFQKYTYDGCVKIKWQNSPKPFFSLSEHPNNKGKAAIEYLCNGEWSKRSDMICLCNKECNSNGDSSFGFPVKSESKEFLDVPVFFEEKNYDISSRYGFVRLKLCSDFGQSEYEKCLVNYIKRIADGTPNGKPPIPPTGPFITEISLGYTATQPIELDSNDAIKFEKRLVHFFHILPFGYAEQHPYLKAQNIKNQENPEVDTSIYLLPQFKTFPAPLPKNSSEDTSRHEAEFYIGITDLKPPQNLSLLFQVADGTANPQKDPTQIYWSYLRNNEWITFPSHAVDDSTDELITSGIITFAVPSDASDDNTLLPAGMHWIRAAVSSDPDAVCRLRMVEAQALKVKFVDKENDPNFSAKTLPKDSITKLARPAAEVKKITQPFPSYGGRGKESSKAFYTRVSERLRHKDRAITLWDYERLILEAFPEVHKVKCLNHTCYDKGNIYDAPGHVTAVTIANKEHHSLPDSLRPNVSLGLQKKIEEFLRPKFSSFVKFHVVNPKFEEIKVDFRVKLHQGVDETYSINTLQEAIVRFLSPWAFSGKGGPSFSGKIYKSALINFIEEQDCVDYLTCFKLMHLGVGNQEHDKEDHEEVQGCSSISILVSVPIGGHKITPIPSFEDGKYINENSPC